MEFIYRAFASKRGCGKIPRWRLGDLVRKENLFLNAN